MPRLCGTRRPLAAVAVVLAALAVAGCSLPLGALTVSGDAAADQTGSLGRTGPHLDHVSVTAQPSASDLAYARAAAATALARGGKDLSVPWANPQSGAGGNITPLATSYSEGGQPCRDFLASYVHGGSQAWLQGAACRSSEGEWQVRSLKPLDEG